MEFVGYADWKQLPEGANALFEQAEKESIFFSRQWFENLVETGIDHGQSTLLACVVDGERVLAILPLVQRDPGQWHSLRHLYTSRYTLLLHQQGGQEVLTCLVEGLVQLPLFSLRLEPVAENDSSLQSLQLALESSGFSCHRYFRFYNWIHRTQGQTFSHYMAARPSRVRNTIARKQRRLERDHDFHVRLYTLDDLPQGMADYHAVYQASWKANEQFGGFVDGLARSLSAPGWLRLAVLYIEEQPVAAQFWFVAHRKASIFKLAYDEAWKQYSPGSILTRFLMEHVIDVDRVEEIDFLTGNDAYKQDWMSERREHWGLYCAKSRQPKSRARKIVDVLKRRLN
jgi:hypothetical protein